MTAILNSIIRFEEKILKLVEAFGFSKDIKKYTPEFMDNSLDADDATAYELIILVTQKSEESISYKNIIFLQSKLIELLGCQVNIINCNTVSELDQYDYIRRSRSLSDTSLCQLFGKSCNHEVIFKALDDEDIDMQNILLEQAEAVLKKINRINLCL